MSRENQCAAHRREPKNSSPQIQRAQHARTPPVARAERSHDLSTQKYYELRNVINTSATKMLTAYHDAKSKLNAHLMRIGAKAEQERTPVSQSDMYAPSAPCLSLMLEEPDIRHRYFGIPLPNPDSNDDTDGCSWWYAHFDGQYVVRQMELHKNKTPVLLQAGTGGSDTQVCKLSLDLTGLTQRPGAEINEYEFEHLWNHFGGRPANLPR